MVQQRVGEDTRIQLNFESVHHKQANPKKTATPKGREKGVLVDGQIKGPPSPRRGKGELKRRVKKNSKRRLAERANKTNFFINGRREYEVIDPTWAEHQGRDVTGWRKSKLGTSKKSEERTVKQVRGRSEIR